MQNQGSEIGSLRKEETAFVGSNIELKCPLTGSSPERIEWTKDFRQLPQNAREVNGELWIKDVQQGNQGRYICVAKNGDSVTSRDAVILHVRDVPSLSVKIQASKEYVHMGDSLDLRCHATGDGAASVRWTKLSHDGHFPENVRVRGAVLSVNGVRAENGGVYRCSIDSPAGTLNDDYVLAIEETPTVAPNEVETRTVPYGSTVVLDCKTNLEEPVAYTWTKQTGNLPHKAKEHHGSLTVPDVGSLDAGTYICTAKSEHATIEIPTVLKVTGLLPRFTQAPLSYMKLPTIVNAYMGFEVEITFKPEKDHGLLLYNGQQEDGGGDFISLGLTNGYLEFRFELGSGVGLLRSQRPVQMDTWHTAKISREKRDAKLKVDDQSEVTGSSQGKMMGLDLTQPLFVGSVPNFDKVSRENGYSVGFVGCVSEIKFGPNALDLAKDSEQVGTTPCETCSLNPCIHDGVCQEAPTEAGYRCICPPGFSGRDCEKVGEACYPGLCGEGRCVNRPGGGLDCYCPFGRTGLRCEREISIVEPAFADDAFVAYPTPNGSLSSLKVNMKIKPRTLDDCLLVYCAQYPDQKGDFTSIGIRNGSVEFRFDTGSGYQGVLGNRFCTFDTVRWALLYELRMRYHRRLAHAQSSIRRSFEFLPRFKGPIAGCRRGRVLGKCQPRELSIPEEHPKIVGLAAASCSCSASSSIRFDVIGDVTDDASAPATPSVNGRSCSSRALLPLRRQRPSETSSTPCDRGRRWRINPTTMRRGAR
ncbi:basement membrane-specific heparan sulfate proteoglycan core protein isoform X4 [Ixodes scapularis]